MLNAARLPNLSFAHNLTVSSGIFFLKRCRSSFANGNQYLHKSKVPTYHFQKSLPRLPIPALEKTCERYLKAQKPLLATEGFDKTQKNVQDFQSGIGKELDAMLREEDKRNKQTSYISEPWFDMYLKDRQPLVLNYNPFMAFVDDPKLGYNDQVTRATNFLISSLRFMKTLRAEILAPEVYHLNPEKSDTDFFRTFVRLLPSSLSWYGAYLFKAFPLDMSQYTSLFNSTRIPELGKDRLIRAEKAKHMLVMKNGHFYVFNVLDAEGNILPAKDIHACIAHIAKDATPVPQHSLGYLSADDRNVWASVRSALIANGNQESFDLIDSAIFNLVLDEEIIGEDPVKAVKTFLHGNGSNRWFDKSFSLIVSKDGKSAVNFEHSWGDGVAVMRYFNEIFKDSTENPLVHPKQEPTATNLDLCRHVRKLEFRLTPQIENAVSQARDRFHKLTDSLLVDVLKYDTMGKKLCKSSKVSPDAIMQLGFQAGYYGMHGNAVATYESCSTAAFKQGRTETIRPCTTYTQAYCKAAAEGKSDAELRNLIEQCSSYHGQLTKEAAMGEGFDRHLFGMRVMAQKRGMTLPALYTDPAYTAINHNVLSTSTLSSPAVLVGGFGPVVNNGYGIGYAIQDEILGAVITTYANQAKGSEMVQSLEKAYQRIESVLRSQKK